MAETRTTTDHDIIRKWAEDRGGRPSRVTDSGPGGILRIDFGDPDEGLEEISWDDFFRIFEERGLALLHQVRGDEGESRFNKFIERRGAGG